MDKAIVQELARTGESYWLGHPNYPGYFVTPEGKVFSARRKRLMKPIRLGKYVGLQVVHKDMGLVKRYLHRLMLEFWTGYAPSNMEACHNNGDRHDNRIANLRWDTASANQRDRLKHGTSGHGERNPMARLTEADAREIRHRVALGEKQKALCPIFGVSPMTISRVVRGQTWNH